MKTSKLFYLIIVLLAFLLIALFPKPALSETTADENWSVEVNDININSATPTSTPKQVSNEKDLNVTSDTDLNSLTPFSFTISNAILDYGILSPTNPIYRTTNLSLSGAINNFMVIGYEDHPLATADSKNFIPDTSCDNGSCSPLTAALWENTLTYGFGYRCDSVTGHDCPMDFNDNNFYKNFSDYSGTKQAEIMISNNSISETHETQLTYKVNISKSQASGSYMNTVTYIAVPGY